MVKVSCTAAVDTTGHSILLGNALLVMMVVAVDMMVVKFYCKSNLSLDNTKTRTTAARMADAN